MFFLVCTLFGFCVLDFLQILAYIFRLLFVLYPACLLSVLRSGPDYFSTLNSMGDLHSYHYFNTISLLLLKNDFWEQFITLELLNYQNIHIFAVLQPACPSEKFLKIQLDIKDIYMAKHQLTIMKDENFALFTVVNQ